MIPVLGLLISTAHAQPVAQAPDNLVIPASCIQFFSTNQVNAPAPGIGFQCIEEFISELTFVIIGLAASISLIMLMVNGIRYMTGPATPGGSSDAAKKGIQTSLVGLAVCLLTYVILDTFIRAITL